MILRARRRNNHSDATQPISRVDYAEAIGDLQVLSWFFLATNHPRSSHRKRSRLVTGQVNHGGYKPQMLLYKINKIIWITALAL